MSPQSIYNVDPVGRETVIFTKFGIFRAPEPTPLAGQLAGWLGFNGAFSAIEVIWQGGNNLNIAHE